MTFEEGCWIGTLIVDEIREAERLSSSGRTNTFVHIKRRTEILAADPEDTQIRDLYSSLVERIRGHDRRA